VISRLDRPGPVRSRPGRSPVDPEDDAMPHRLDPNVLHHPAVVDEVERRASDAQLRIADRITAFAGSMQFVYLHAILFAAWMLVFEKSPWPTLTLIVSLEAIFLSTFVMIGQNRQASFQQKKADHDYGDVNRLLVENTDLTRLIHQLTAEVHDHIITKATPSPAAQAGPAGPAPGDSPPPEASS
jgi:uncharacterized membrane protein